MLHKFWDPRVARALFTGIIFLFVFEFLRAERETLTLFLFAILFAYLVEPLVARLERPLRGRMKAVGVVYLLLLGILVGLGLLVGSRIGQEGRSLATSLPSLLDRMGSGQLVSQVGHSHGWSEERQAQIQSFFSAHRLQMLDAARVVGRKLAEPARHIWWLVLIPILSLFFLKDGKSIAQAMEGLARDPEERATAHGVISDTNIMLGSYIRAQLTLASLTLAAYTVVLSLLRVPYAFILGPLAGVFEFIPVVGPTVAAVSVIVIAVLTGYAHPLLLLLFLAAWRLTQDYVNSPRIMGRSLEISPLAQIFGVLAGAELGGVVGALIAVPSIAILRILWRRLSSHADARGPATAALPQGDARATAGLPR